MTAHAISRDAVLRDAVLRDLAAAVLEPAELLAAHAGDRTPVAERGHLGMLTTGQGGYRVEGDVVVLDGWCGITQTVPLAVLFDIAADAGTEAAAVRLGAALADRDRAHRDAARYIQRHGEDGMILSPAHRQAPEWLALVARMGAVRAAAAAWWSGEEIARVPGEQLDLFDVG
jgi:hypothetical protein